MIINEWIHTVYRNTTGYDGNVFGTPMASKYSLYLHGVCSLFTRKFTGDTNDDPAGTYFQLRYRDNGQIIIDLGYIYYVYQTSTPAGAKIMAPLGNSQFNTQPFCMKLDATRPIAVYTFSGAKTGEYTNAIFRMTYSIRQTGP